MSHLCFYQSDMSFFFACYGGGGDFMALRTIKIPKSASDILMGNSEKMDLLLSIQQNILLPLNYVCVGGMLIKFWKLWDHSTLFDPLPFIKILWCLSKINVYWSWLCISNISYWLLNFWKLQNSSFPLIWYFPVYLKSKCRVTTDVWWFICITLLEPPSYMTEKKTPNNQLSFLSHHYYQN